MDLEARRAASAALVLAAIAAVAALDPLPPSAWKSIGVAVSLALGIGSVLVLLWSLVPKRGHTIAPQTSRDPPSVG